MPPMRPIKREPGVGGSQDEVEEASVVEEQLQLQQHPSQRRRVDDGGLAGLQTRLLIEAQAAAFQGMEQARVIGLELQQAKVQNAELKAEIRNRDAALEAKDAIIQGKDVTLLAKDDVIEGKDALLQAKDAEISRLQADLEQRHDDEPEAQPAPARASGWGVGGEMLERLSRLRAAAQGGAGFVRVIGEAGDEEDEYDDCVPRFARPYFSAFDDDCNLAVLDFETSCIKVVRYRDGLLLRKIGCFGVCNGQFKWPWSIAFDRLGHLVVADWGNDRVQVLSYRDGTHIRTIGSRGSGTGQLDCPSGVAIDHEGNIVVQDGHVNGRIQVFRLSDGAHIRSICSKGRGEGQLSGHGCVAFDDEGNLVVGDNGGVFNACIQRIQVLRYRDGLHLRTIGGRGGGPGKFSWLEGFALDLYGQLVVVDGNSYNVQVLRYRDGAHVRTIGGKGRDEGRFKYPQSVAIDGDGRVVVCDSHNCRVQVLT